MTYDQQRILEDHELDALARQVRTSDPVAARQEYGRLVINATAERLRGRLPSAPADPIHVRARNESMNLMGANAARRDAFESGVRWLLDSGFVTETDKKDL